MYSLTELLSSTKVEDIADAIAYCLEDAIESGLLTLDEVYITATKIKKEGCWRLSIRENTIFDFSLVFDERGLKLRIETELYSCMCQCCHIRCGICIYSNINGDNIYDPGPYRDIFYVRI
ncbi:MAG: hypothetical protein ACTSQY_00625 [Candidatus Odinarchaeia archaeon]|nr:MAG: hypothetical protein [Lokiarchaeota virus Fenrir Meg22_1012]URC17303.1 MAG: hypothetical protein [Lokiarchaeota virus Fenrir Meg22_1214]